MNAASTTPRRTRRSQTDPLDAMLTIHHVALHEPPGIAFDAVQAAERNLGYAHLVAPGARFALPRGHGRIDAAETARLARADAVLLPIAPARCSLSDLALAAAHALTAAAGAAVVAQSTHVIMAQASLNEQIVESVAGRVQQALGLGAVLPFGLGQCGTLGFFAALALAPGLLRDGGQILLVAADKWLYPFFRVHGDFVAYGDGAGALLLRAGAGEGGSRVLGHALSHGDAITDPWAMAPDELEVRLLPQVVVAARAALADAGAQPSDLHFIAPAGFRAGFRAAVAAALGVDATRLMARHDAAHRSSADTLAALRHAEAALVPGERRLALFCDAALAGMAGAAVVELHGAARRPALDSGNPT